MTYIVYPDEGHGFARPANSMSFYAITEVFLGQCLGGCYEAINNQIEGSSVVVPAGAEFIPGLTEALAARTETGLPGEVALAEADPAVPEGYAGSYTLEAYDVVISVLWNGEQLMLEMPGEPDAELFPSSDTEFFFKVTPSTVGFFSNEDGSVCHFILYSEGTETRANREN